MHWVGSFVRHSKEMFTRLHIHGEVLLASEIESWASFNGWHAKDAAELGALAQQIGMGKKVRISRGPWWKENILELFQDELLA